MLIPRTLEENIMEVQGVLGILDIFLVRSIEVQRMPRAIRAECSIVIRRI